MARHIPQTPDELADAIFGKDDQTKEKPKKHFVVGGQAMSKPSLKLESETRVYTGKFGKYTITDGIANIELNKETVLAVEKPSLVELTKEIEELGGLM